MKNLKALLVMLLALSVFICAIPAFTTLADQVDEPFPDKLAEVAGYDVYSFSFDWELLYPTTDQSEIYFAVTAQEESYHHYLERFVYGTQAAGTSGTVNVSYNFYGKCNQGNTSGHGAVVLAGAPVIQFLSKMVPGFAIDNFTIKKNGTVIFSTDFSDSALPAGLTLGTHTDYYGTIGVQDGRFVADSGQADMDVNSYNWHMQVLKVDGAALDIAWCPGGVSQAGVVDGAYVVDNGGNPIGKDGAYFPVFQTDPDLLQLEWGKGYTYRFEFDYMRTHAADTAGYMHMQMVDRKNTLLKQDYVGNGNAAGYTHASFDLDANGSGVNEGDTVIVRVVGNQFKGMAFDNMKVTRIKDGAEEVIYDEDFVLTEGEQGGEQEDGFNGQIDKEFPDRFAELSGLDVYEISFDWELLYETTSDLSEIYMTVTSTDGSYHHYMERFVYGKKAAGTSGTVDVTYNFFGKCNQGNDSGHGDMVLAGIPTVQILPKMVPGFAIDNFTIRKNGEIVLSSDFSGSALPQGLAYGWGHSGSVYSSVGVQDGKFVADNGGFDMDEEYDNYHVQVLKVDENTLPMVWGAAGAANVGVSNGEYIVDNNGNPIGKDGGYFPVLQSDPDLLNIEWGKGYTYRFEFDYKKTYADDTAGNLFFQAVTRNNVLLNQQGSVADGAVTEYTHASFDLNANGDGAKEGDLVIMRLIGNQFKGMAFDNVKVTRIKDGVETVLYEEDFVLTEGEDTMYDPDAELVYREDFDDEETLLVDVGGKNLLYVSFDYNLPYGAPLGAELYFLVDTADASRHMYMNLFFDGKKAETPAGYSGTFTATVDLSGKGTEIHGKYNDTGMPVLVQILGQKLAGVVIDNLIIKDAVTNEVLMESDFSDSLPDGLKDLNGNIGFQSASVADGVYKVDNAGTVVEPWNTILAVDGKKVPINWGGKSGFGTADVVDGRYEVHNNGDKLHVGYYTPIFEIDPTKLVVEWGAGYTYEIEFDYTLPYGADADSAAVFVADIVDNQDKHCSNMHWFANTVLNSGYSGHFKGSWDLNGEGVTPYSKLIFRILATGFKGITIDNLRVTRRLTSEPAKLPDTKVILDTDFDTFPEGLVELDNFGGYVSIGIEDGQYVADSWGEMVSQGFSTILMTNPYTTQMFWGEGHRYKIEFDYTLPYGTSSSNTEIYLLGDPFSMGDCHGIMDKFVAGIVTDTEPRHYEREFDFSGMPQYWSDTNVIPEKSLMYILIVAKDASGIVIDNLKITDLNDTGYSVDVDFDTDTPEVHAQPVDVTIHLTDADGKPLANQTLKMDSEELMKTDANGYVTLKAVTDGAHTIYVTDEDGNVLFQTYFTIRPGDATSFSGAFATIDSTVSALTVHVQQRGYALFIDSIEEGTVIPDGGNDSPDDKPGTSPDTTPDTSPETGNTLPLVATVMAVLSAAILFLLQKKERATK